MAESSLSIGLPELRKKVGAFLGYGSSGTTFTAKLTEIDDVIQSGVRRVYYPTAVSEETVGYEWSWLRPTTTLPIVSGDADYDLPDDFARLMSEFYYPAAEYRGPIQHVSVGRVLALRSSSSLTGAPTCVAIRHKASTGTTGQRQEALFFPTPDAAWTLSYEYEAYQGVLTLTYPYPLGGMKLSELYIQSCLAVAERDYNDEKDGNHKRQYEELLVDAIARDRKNGPRNFGHMGNIEPQSGEFHRGWTGSTYPIIYKGVTY